MVDLDLRFYFAVFWRKLPYFLAITITVTMISIVAAYLMPRVYRASAKILLEAPQISASLASSTVAMNPVEQLQIIQQKITTSDNLLALAEKLDVYGSERADLSEAEVVEDMRSRSSFEQLQLDIGGGGGATVFNVSFDAGEPNLAARVVNELVALVLSKNVRLRTDRAENTTEFFNNEVAQLGSELKRLETDILKFKTAHGDALPDGLDFHRNKQATLQEKLLLLEHEEAQLRSRRNNLVQMYDSTGRIAGSAPVTPEQQMLQDLNRALTEQLAIFSETSPNVLALRARIASLQEGLRSRQADSASGKTGPSQLDLQLMDIDERLAFIAKESSSITEELDQLTKSIDATPANETVLNSLERDRTNVQTQYNAATARLAEASTGEQIEVLSKGPRFSVVEPATPPERAVSPHRRRIAALGGVAGIGLGLGFIVLLEMLNKTIRRPVDLVQMFQAQPLATIPYIWTASEVRRGGVRHRLAALFGSGVMAVLLASTYYFMPLGLVVEKLGST